MKTANQSRTQVVTGSADDLTPGENLTPEETEALRKRLDAGVGKLRAAVSTADAQLFGPGTSTTGAGDDEVDAGTRTAELDNEQSLAEATVHHLTETEHALARMEAGTYGRCESCEQAIGTERLFAFPRATLCLTCQSEHERIGT